MPDNEWVEIGTVEEFKKTPLRQVTVKKTKLAVIHKDGEFSAISGMCNHVGGPLGEGNLEGDYVVCPWHYWKFHYKTGHGEPGFEEDCVPAYAVKVENDRVWVDIQSGTKRHQKRMLRRLVGVKKLMEEKLRPHLEAMAPYVNKPLSLEIRIESEGYEERAWLAGFTRGSLTVEDSTNQSLNLSLHVHRDDILELLDRELTVDEDAEKVYGDIGRYMELFRPWNRAIRNRPKKSRRPPTHDPGGRKQG